MLEAVEIARVEGAARRPIQESDLRGHLEGDAAAEAAEESTDGTVRAARIVECCFAPRMCQARHARTA